MNSSLRPLLCSGAVFIFAIALAKVNVDVVSSRQSTFGRTAAISDVLELPDNASLSN
jgi:hypothetical protein